jgi:hypothetical protein
VKHEWGGSINDRAATSAVAWQGCRYQRAQFRAHHIQQLDQAAHIDCSNTSSKEKQPEFNCQ